MAEGGEGERMNLANFISELARVERAEAEAALCEAISGGSETGIFAFEVVGDRGGVGGDGEESTAAKLEGPIAGFSGSSAKAGIL